MNKVYIMAKDGGETTAYSVEMRDTLISKGWALAYEGTVISTDLGEGKTETVYYFPKRPGCEVERYVADTWQDLVEIFKYPTLIDYARGERCDYSVNDPWWRKVTVE